MNCTICGEVDADEYLTVGRYQFVKCRTCDLITIANFSHEETSYVADDYFVLKNRYVERWEDFSTLFDGLMTKIGRFRKSGKLLDVGAGVGCLVASALRYGFSAQGIEVSKWAARFAREEKGLPIRTGLLEDAEFGPDYFDVVVINHVLEHVDDPKGMLAEVRRILKPGGMLVIGVPNIGSIMAHLKGGRWASLRPEEHIWHFTPVTLKHLVRESFFKELWFEAKDNYEVEGWGAKDLAIRAINALAVATNRSEAMLLFAEKASGENS